MIRLVIFDLAGTTVEDPDGVGGALKAALTAANVPWLHQEVNAVMGTPKPKAIESLLKVVGENPTPERVDSIFQDFRAKMIAYYRDDPAVREVEGASQVFRELKSLNILVGLDTGFDRMIVDVLLARMGWTDDLIDVSVTSDEVPQGRPHPDLIFRAMELVSIHDAKSVAKVGDTPSDLGEGTSAGCGLVIGVTSGTHTREELQRQPHTHLSESIRDLPALLEAASADR